MANTYVAISTVTVGSGGSSAIDFTSIANTYTDLIVLCSLRGDRPTVLDYVEINFNSDTTAGNYTRRILLGDGSTASSTAPSARDFYISADNATASVFANSTIYIPNYAGSNYKSASIDSVSENNATEAYQSLTAYLWSNTAAITAIKLTPDYGIFRQYSTATLYGVKSSQEIKWKN